MWDNAKYVSLNSPVLSLTDTNGLICGIFDSAKTLITENLLSFGSKGNTNRWGYFMINPTALKKIASYAELGQVHVVSETNYLNGERVRIILFIKSLAK